MIMLERLKRGWKGEEMTRETKFCSNCGAEIDKKAEICPKCGVRIKPPVEIKNPGLAGVLSFFIVGLGQIYNGQIGKGIILIILYIISIALCWVIVGFILLPILWIYGIYDAYKTAKRINSEWE
jgi:TM2 domain-containing membrane protein YozV/ribosomal protein S27AE